MGGFYNKLIINNDPNFYIVKKAVEEELDVGYLEFHFTDNELLVAKTYTISLTVVSLITQCLGGLGFSAEPRLFIDFLVREFGDEKKMNWFNFNIRNFLELYGFFFPVFAYILKKHYERETWKIQKRQIEEDAAAEKEGNEDENDKSQLVLSKMVKIEIPESKCKKFLYFMIGVPLPFVLLACHMIIH